MKRYLAVLLILFMAGFITACNLPHQEAVNAHDRNSKLTDRELEAAIQAKLNRNLSFSRVRLIVDSENNNVVLLGTVASEQQRAEVIELARNGNAELLITDIMQVK
jgi:outer membrane lipopolysaccharide assembly protein LptE/RlpB